VRGLCAALSAAAGEAGGEAARAAARRGPPPPPPPSSALVPFVDVGSVPLRHPGLAFSRAMPAAPGAPRATITPLWDEDPPVWSGSKYGASARVVPPELSAALAPLPPAAARNVKAAVVVPFYTEAGYALRRGLEALALQRADLRRHARLALGAPPGALPELHVFAIGDGWRKADGARILSESMLAELLDLFGPTLDVGELLAHLEGPPPPGRAEPPAHVLVQFCAHTGAGRAAELRPLAVPCGWAAGMRARANDAPPSGVAADFAEAARMSSAPQKARSFMSDFSARLFSGAEEESLLGGGGRRANAHGGVDGEEEDASAALPIFFTLMIKRRNGKKHHSHRWFFEAFAPITALRAGPAFQFCFATDAGTLYAPYLLAELMRHMERHPRCGAATGHQRIMAKDDQADPDSEDPETWLGARLRDVQGFDFESGLCVFNGMHALAGFLPVVPGPCGLFRWEALTEEILGAVRDICTSRGDGLIQANLKIAEDRILSYLLVLVEEGGGAAWETHWVPSTTFFFESEDTLRELVLQRRRWLNGTTAGYLWLLRQPALWEGVARGRRTACNVLVLSVLQLVVFGVVFVFPGFFVVTGYLSIGGLVLLLELAGLPPASFTQTLQAAYLAAALGTLAAHMWLARAGAASFTPWVWTARLVLNAFTMALMGLVSLLLLPISFAAPQAIVSALSQDPAGQATAKPSVQSAQVAGLLGLLYLFTPFFLAMMHSRESFLTMAKCFPTFFLFQPTVRCAPGALSSVGPPRSLSPHTHTHHTTK
jgi:cellulose synthase/poly-beta-1,6-N-acetylglucosamine synthase-like glycosyltransferase